MDQSERVSEMGVQTINTLNSNPLIIERTVNVMDLYNSQNLNQMSNVVWSSANHPTYLSFITENSTSVIENTANVITSNPQLIDLITLI